MNKNFKIIICEDEHARRAMIEAMIKSLKNKYPYLADPKQVAFKDILNNCLVHDKPDLLILDLYDNVDDKWYGIDCLEIIKTSGINTKTIIFAGDKQGDMRKRNFKKDYPFVLDDIDKYKEKISGLSEMIEVELINKLPIQYKLKNENDLILQLQISTIGESNLNQILRQIKEEYGIADEVLLERMVSGYSGAILIRFYIDNTAYILKISKDTESLKKEYEDSLKYYPKFPSIFFNYIHSKEYYTNNYNALGILIKLVEDGETIFDYIKKESNTFEDIYRILNRIFMDDYSLKRHYKEQRYGSENWTHIFRKYKGTKYSIIESVINEIRLLINDFGVNYSNMKNLSINQSYERLDKNNKNIDKPLVLCHGDLHSRNILIQGLNPFLIDTGGISYDYWCSDLCRLIVDLFLKGIDNDKKEYYDISQIEKNVKIAELIITRKDVELDGVNDNYINAINWLTNHVDKIYDDLFDIFDFQLCLMKEFMQASTRVGTIPPNKRAIALISAYRCMVFANESIML
ncbi:phosphotransferase [Chlorobium ferrooxidans]|nr:phosphotransferase [Chlorobium ferrooxidans]